MSAATAASPEGRKLLRPAVPDAQTPIARTPSWIRTRAKLGPQYRERRATCR
jgi:lipoyl synthase